MKAQKMMIGAIMSEQANATERIVLGLDIGGTSVKMGLVSSAGTTLGTSSVPTGELDNAEAYARVTDAIKAFAETTNVALEDISAVGIDVPGVVVDNKLLMLPNATLDLDGLLAALKAAIPDANFAVLNDANAAALGETWLGAGGGVKSLVMLTLGTGVGGGIVSDGRVLEGAHGAGAEVGHMCVNYEETETCGCGNKGCLEQYTSAKGLIKLYREECAKDGVGEIEIAHATDALAVFVAARTGNKQALAACKRLAFYLAHALANLAATCDPEVFVIGGGMCGGWDTFGEDLLAYYKEFAIPGVRDTPILVATLGNAAGFTGAAYAALSAPLDITRN